MRPIYLPAASTSATDSAPAILDYMLTPFSVALTLELGGNTGGGASYTAYYSSDDPYASYATSYAANANWYALAAITTASADTNTSLTVPVRAVKLKTVTPGTGGTVAPQLVVIQAGVR